MKIRADWRNISPTRLQNLRKKLLSNDYDNSDNEDAVNMEFLDANFKINNDDDEIESLEEFTQNLADKSLVVVKSN